MGRNVGVAGSRDSAELINPKSLQNLAKGRIGRKSRPCVKVNALSFGLMLQYLVEHPHTSFQELADHSGLHYITVGDWVRVWHKLKLVHISGWDPDSLGRPNVKLYSFGPGPDVKRMRKSDAQKARDYRIRKKRNVLQNVWHRLEVAADA